MKKMKKLLILLSLFVGILLLVPTSASADNKWVSDEADVIDTEVEDRIYEINEDTLQELELAPQYAVMTIKKLPKGYDIDEYKAKVFNDLGIGEKSKDNGLLFLIAVDDRKFGIEVGYGLEEYVTDAIAGRLVSEDVKDDFRDEDYSSGILKVSNSVEDVLIQADEGTLTDDYGKEENSLIGMIILGLIGGLFSLGAVGVLVYAVRRSLLKRSIIQTLGTVAFSGRREMLEGSPEAAAKYMISYGKLKLKYTKEDFSRALSEYYMYGIVGPKIAEMDPHELIYDNEVYQYYLEEYPDDFIQNPDYRMPEFIRDTDKKHAIILEIIANNTEMIETLIEPWLNELRANDLTEAAVPYIKRNVLAAYDLKNEHLKLGDLRAIFDIASKEGIFDYRYQKLVKKDIEQSVSGKDYASEKEFYDELSTEDKLEYYDVTDAIFISMMMSRSTTYIDAAHEEYTASTSSDSDFGSGFGGGSSGGGGASGSW